MTLPTLLHLTTGQSLLLALAATVIFSLPSLLHLLRPMTARRWLLMLALLPLLAGIAWGGRIWVPPASLWISGSALSPEFDVATRSPQGQLRLTPDALTEHGLYAYTAIHAPRGLREQIVHAWRHDGELIDRIPLEIQGGREEGYRAWTHKRNFPADSAGRWRIDVMTASGQRIGVLRFQVAPDAEAATFADGRIDVPLGCPGWIFVDWWRVPRVPPTSIVKIPLTTLPLPQRITSSLRTIRLHSTPGLQTIPIDFFNVDTPCIRTSAFSSPVCRASGAPSLTDAWRLTG